VSYYPNPAPPPATGDPLLALAIEPKSVYALHEAQSRPAVVIACPAHKLIRPWVNWVVGSPVLISAAFFSVLQIPGLQDYEPPVWALPTLVIGFALIVIFEVLVRLFSLNLDSYIALTPGGIVVRRWRTQVAVRWEEVAYVRVAVNYQREWRLLEAFGADIRTGMNTEVRASIQLLPAVPKFGGRTDVRPLVWPILVGTRQTKPFTHRIALPARIFAHEGKVPAARIAVIGLQRFAGRRYMGHSVDRSYILPPR
jgi:hypothetical protein